MGRELNSRILLRRWEEELKNRVQELYRQGIIPCLNIIRVGDRPDSKLYVENKIKKCIELGVNAKILNVLDNEHTEDDVAILCGTANVPTIVQMPLPKWVDARRCVNLLDPAVDVDGLGTIQKGYLQEGSPYAYEPATAKGVIRLIEGHGPIEGKKVVIVSRSELIGLPLAKMILDRDGYPMVLHSKVCWARVRYEMRCADIVVTGCGKRSIFDCKDAGMASEQLIIDCSMAKERDIDGVGDFNKESVIKYTDACIASGYGHTGPATILGLIDNVLKAYESGQIMN